MKKEDLCSECMEKEIARYQNSQNRLTEQLELKTELFT